MPSVNLKEIKKEKEKDNEKTEYVPIGISKCWVNN